MWPIFQCSLVKFEAKSIKKYGLLPMICVLWVPDSYFYKCEILNFYFLVILVIFDM